MKKDEIRNANRKALPKFLLVLAVSMVIGGAVGYGSSKYGLDKMAGSITDVGMYFGTHIAPWLMAAIAVIVPVICIPIYRSAKKLLCAWDGENEDISDAIDGKLSTSIWIQVRHRFSHIFSLQRPIPEALQHLTAKDARSCFLLALRHSSLL